jgi:hypothetical protein
MGKEGGPYPQLGPDPVKGGSFLPAAGTGPIRKEETSYPRWDRTQWEGGSFLAAAVIRLSVIEGAPYSQLGKDPFGRRELLIHSWDRTQ